jgi:hypothetical protein
MSKSTHKNENSAAAQEINRRLQDYKSSQSPQKKLKAATALSLLALISSLDDDSEIKQLLATLKKIEK